MSTEYLLPSHTVIVSTSDLQGNIVSFNKAFLEASGYNADDVIGKPHSILRHPDMPKDAFKDLWDTIIDGRPWFGLVKNLRKNGEHYWVAANACPIYTNGHITGYVSVRYPATKEQKNSRRILLCWYALSSIQDALDT
jgi:methyl-accepting chemotaxis protein